MTDKEIMEMFIQVHKCLYEVLSEPHSCNLPKEITKLEILINQAANRTSLPAIETELYPR